MQQSQQLTQSHKLEQRQAISVCKLLSMHPAAIDAVLDAMDSDYGRTEKILESVGNKRTEKGVQGIFTSLFPNKAGQDYGFIMAPSIEPLEELLTQDEIKIDEDAIFVQRKNMTERPEIFFSDKILPRKPELTMEQIPAEYKKTKQLYQQLEHFREWSNKAAREGYLALADIQREFINSLEPTRKNICDLVKLGATLNLHKSTVYRLYRGRYVIIENHERSNKVFLPTKELICSKTGLLKIQRIHALNAYFREEAKTGTGLSDTDIAGKVRFIRRTIAKHRNDADIPCGDDRTKAYQENPSTVYQIHI